MPRCFLAKKNNNSGMGCGPAAANAVNPAKVEFRPQPQSPHRRVFPRPRLGHDCPASKDSEPAAEVLVSVRPHRSTVGSITAAQAVRSIQEPVPPLQLPSRPLPIEDIAHSPAAPVSVEVKMEAVESEMEEEEECKQKMHMQTPLMRHQQQTRGDRTRGESRSTYTLLCLPSYRDLE